MSDYTRRVKHDECAHDEPLTQQQLLGAIGCCQTTFPECTEIEIGQNVVATLSLNSGSVVRMHTDIVLGDNYTAHLEITFPDIEWYDIGEVTRLHERCLDQLPHFVDLMQTRSQPA